MVFVDVQYENWFNRENASVVLLIKGKKKRNLRNIFLREVITIVSNQLGFIP